MYYNNLYEKNYVADDSDLTISVRILPKLEGSDIYVYDDTYVKYVGAKAKVVKKDTYIKIVPTSPLTNDWLAVIEDIRCDEPCITLYVTPYTKKIKISSQIGTLINKLLFEAKKEYHDIKEQEIRLYTFNEKDHWLKQCCPSQSFLKYDYCRRTLCLLDKSYELPSKKGYFFGTVKKTIVDKNNKLVDIVKPLSLYIFSDYDSLIARDMFYLEEDLLTILKSIMDLREDEFFYRIFYHYAQNDENLMKLYKKSILTSDSVIRNEAVVKMLEMYRADVVRSLTDEKAILDIYDILNTPQPIKGLPYYLSLTASEANSKFKGEAKVWQAFYNGEYKNEYVSDLNTDLCINFTIEKTRDSYSFIDVYYFHKK